MQCSLMATVSLTAAPRPLSSGPRPQRAAPAPRRSPQRRLMVAASAAVDAKTDQKMPMWAGMQADLSKAKVASLSPEDAFNMAELGQAVLIDVRPQEDHEQAHPKGAINVPAFIVIDSPSSPGEWGKWIACKANGVVPTKVNPDLASKVAAAATEGKAAILACEAGGTLEPSVNFPQGKVSRSLKAVWKVVNSQVLPTERVKHLDGGVYRWAAMGLPMVGEYDASKAGRTPAVAEVPTGRFIDGERE